MPTKRRPISAAFNAGQTPSIAVVNQAKTPLGFSLPAFTTAMQAYVDNHFAPVWGTPAKLKYVAGKVVPKASWVMVFLDTADEAGALAYHDLTADGFPLMKVFVKTTLDDNASVSVSATHELAEALVDPAINLMCQGPTASTIYALETADPVEETSFKVNGFDMSNFVYPSYFEGFHKQHSTQFDHLNLVTKPFQMLPGGYQSILKNGKWTEVFGSTAKRKRFAREDRSGHRSESRGTRLRRARAF